MNTRVSIWFLATLAICASAGCDKDNALSYSRDKSYSDNIQKRVDAKIAQQTAPQTAGQRWANYVDDVYQHPGDLAADMRRLEHERLRAATAKVVLDQGPLQLNDCLVLSLEFNDEIQAARAVVASMAGEKLIANSRFLPKLAVDLSASTAGRDLARHISVGGDALGTLLEFGKDNPIDVNLRALERQSLFDYEAHVSAVLSAVRLRFFTILLKERQLAERQKLRDEFSARYERVRKLEAVRRVLEVDLLTAELNVLNEGSRINALEKEILRQKMDLLHAIGFPVAMTDYDLDGSFEKFGLSVDDAVAVAYARSTRIAQARADLYEQDRLTRQLIWDYFPFVESFGGYDGGSWSVGTNVQNTNGTYKVRPYAERPVDRWHFLTLDHEPFGPFYNNSGLYGAMDMRLPIFTGLERTGTFKRDRAFVDVSRFKLSNTVALTELEVRKCYQTVLEKAKETEFLQETVRISKERLRVQERLKDLGRISDNELETFRDRFFSDQDRLFEEQITLVDAQEKLRLAMRYFDPVAPKESANVTTTNPTSSPSEDEDNEE